MLYPRTYPREPLVALLIVGVVGDVIALGVVFTRYSVSTVVALLTAVASLGQTMSASSRSSTTANCASFSSRRSFEKITRLISHRHACFS